MKNKFLKTSFIILLLVFQFIVIVNAHPGRTDSNGGHYDRSTGEYHYHDGESAGKNQSSNNETYTYENFVGPTQDYEKFSNNTSNTEKNNVENSLDWVSLILNLFFAFIIILGNYLYFKDKINEKAEKKTQEVLKQTKADLHQKVHNYNKSSCEKNFEYASVHKNIIEEHHEFQEQIKYFSVLLEQLQLLAEDELTKDELKNKFFLSDAVAFSISLILLENKEIDSVRLTQHLISIVLEKEEYECNESELTMLINNRIKDFTKTIENSNYDTIQEFNNSFHEDFIKELRNTPYKRLILDYCNYYALGYVTKKTYSSEDIKSPIEISIHDLYPLKKCVRQTYTALSIIYNSLFVDKRL